MTEEKLDKRQQRIRKDMSENKGKIIKLQGRYGQDLDYISGYDDGEPPQGQEGI